MLWLRKIKQDGKEMVVGASRPWLKNPLRLFKSLAIKMSFKPVSADPVKCFNVCDRLLQK